MAAPRPGTVRIIGGRWRSRVLPVVDAPGLRPTTDRVRETLFNWLTHAFGGSFADRAVLDLYAGTGILGFEAASRGATPVTLVERDAAAVRRLHAARALLAAEAVEIRTGDALSHARALQSTGRRFDLVLLDPPFGRGLLDEALPAAVSLLEPDGLVYVEAEAPVDPALLERCALARYRADKAGEVFYHLLQRNIEER